MANDKFQMTNELQISNVKFVIWILLFIWVLTFGFWNYAYARDNHVYNSQGRRDPFMPLVGVMAKVVESLEDILSIDDVELQGVAGDHQGRMFAIINGEMLKEGETVGRLTIKEVSENEVRLNIDEAEYTLSVQEDTAF